MDKFDAILKAYDLVRTEDSLATFGSDAATRERGARHFVEAKDRLFALIDTLTPTEAEAFNDYRRNLRG